MPMWVPSGQRAHVRTRACWDGLGGWFERFFPERPTMPGLEHQVGWQVVGMLRLPSGSDCFVRTYGTRMQRYCSCSPCCNHCWSQSNTDEACLVVEQTAGRPASKSERETQKQNFSLVPGARFDIRMGVSSNPNIIGPVDGEVIRLIRANKSQRVRIGWERLKQPRGGGRSVGHRRGERLKAQRTETAKALISRPL